MIRLPERWRRREIAIALAQSFSRELRAELVSAAVCGPFAAYRGSRYGTGGDCFTLLHLPSQTPMFTLPHLMDCREAAQEVSGLDLEWWTCIREEVTGPDLPKASEVYRRWKERGC